MSYIEKITLNYFEYKFYIKPILSLDKIIAVCIICFCYISVCCIQQTCSEDLAPSSNNSEHIETVQPEQEVVTSTAPINITSDYLERNPENNSVIARGSVVIVHHDIIVNADEAEYFMDQKKIKAKGNVRVEEADQIIKGDEIVYFFEASSGTIRDSKGFSPPWIIRGKVSERVSKEKAIVRNGYFTSCDHENPHYKFKAKKVTIYFKKRIVAYHTFLMIHGIPVLYLPIMYQSLKDRKPEFEVIIGKNNTDGTFVKVKFGYPFTKDDKVTLYIDNYSKKGLGKGIQYDYKREDKLNGSFYTYHIKEQIKNEDDSIIRTQRWNFRGNHWHRLTERFITSLNLNYQSDQSFEDSYRYITGPSVLYPTRVTEERVNTNIQSYFSASYTPEKYSVLTVWEREQIWNDTYKRFDIVREYLPRMQFSTTKNRLFSTLFYYQYSLNLLNSYNTANKSYYLSGNTSFSLTTKLNLGRMTTITPSVGFTEVCSNEVKEDDDKIKKVYTPSYFTVLSMRNRLTRSIDFDISHQYAQKLDYSRSIETNLISAGLYSYFFGRLIVRMSSAYNINIKEYNAEEVNDFRQRMGPLVTEARYRASSNVSIFARHEYNLYKNWTPQLQGTFELKTNNGWYIREYLRYVRPSDSALLTAFETGEDIEKIDVITTFGFEIAQKWKVESSLRADYFHKSNQWSDFNEKEFSIIRDLHCWESRLLWKSRQEDTGGHELHTVNEIWIMLHIKALPAHKINMYKKGSGYWSFQGAQ
ncbi:LPS-assembly protein LptD [bacterium]